MAQQNGDACQSSCVIAMDSGHWRLANSAYWKKQHYLAQGQRGVNM
jgi:hypothetical protein